MFARILIGIADEHDAADAIALARLLAAPDAEFTLAHVFDSDAHIAPALAQVVRRDTALEMLRTVRADAGIEADVVVARDRRPGLGLARLAAERVADLIVIGASRNVSVWRLLAFGVLGDVLEKLRCALAVAPSGFVSPAALGTIAAGYDGSPSSVAAVRAARALAGDRGAELRVVSVLDPQTGGGSEPARPDEHAEMHVLRGEPIDELNRYASTVDLLVIGTRLPGRSHRLRPPSGTCHALAQHARGPLLVVPDTAGRPANPAAVPAAGPTKEV